MSASPFGAVRLSPFGALLHASITAGFPLITGGLLGALIALPLGTVLDALPDFAVAGVAWGVAFAVLGGVLTGLGNFLLPWQVLAAAKRQLPTPPPLVQREFALANPYPALKPGGYRIFSLPVLVLFFTLVGGFAGVPYAWWGFGAGLVLLALITWLWRLRKYRWSKTWPAQVIPLWHSWPSDRPAVYLPEAGPRWRRPLHVAALALTLLGGLGAFICVGIMVTDDRREPFDPSTPFGRFVVAALPVLLGLLVLGAVLTFAVWVLRAVRATRAAGTASTPGQPSPALAEAFNLGHPPRCWGAASTYLGALLTGALAGAGAAAVITGCALATVGLVLIAVGQAREQPLLQRILDTHPHTDVGGAPAGMLTRFIRVIGMPGFGGSNT